MTRTKKTVGSKQYQSVLLVKSVRINGKPRPERILNLSQWSNEQVAALEFTLKGKKGIRTRNEVTATTEKGIGGGIGCGPFGQEAGYYRGARNDERSALGHGLNRGSTPHPRIAAQAMRMAKDE